MGSIQADPAELVLRYLSGHLTPAERDAFERALPERPDLREHAEQVLKLQEGLARLRERGELDALLQPRARPRWLPYAAAAVVAILSLAALGWFYLAAAPSKLLALSPAEFTSGQRPPPVVVGSYVLARTRGSAPAIELPHSGVIEIRALPSVLSSSVSYRAEVIASAGTAGGRLVGQLDAGRAADDGYVTFYLDLAQLASGPYEVLLAPSVAAGPDSKADRFPMRVR